MLSTPVVQPYAKLFSGGMTRSINFVSLASPPLLVILPLPYLPRGAGELHTRAGPRYRRSCAHFLSNLSSTDNAAPDLASRFLRTFSSSLRLLFASCSSSAFSASFFFASSRACAFLSALTRAFSSRSATLTLEASSDASFFSFFALIWMAFCSSRSACERKTVG